jgi:hypothetical protein
LADFGKAIKLLGTCEGDLMEKVFSEVGSKSEMLSIKLQREVIMIFSYIVLLGTGYLAEQFISMFL